jgi:serine/threonine protein kinase
VSEILGRVLGGTYRIERRIGGGGMGAVYEARHARTGRLCAVKVLLPEVAPKIDASARFRREAEALSALAHPHIVAIHDWNLESDGLAYLVMDRLEGEDLASRLRRGPLAPAAALAFFDQIASALAAAHAIGVIHRDLKPANVFLARDATGAERAVLLDFGLAKNLDGDPAHAITATGLVMGTPHYMSPEQAQGRALDARSDVYGLGAILLEMLTGLPPFSAPTIASLFVQILTTPAPTVASRGVAVSATVEDALRRCLEKDPGDRWPDVASARAAIDPTRALAPATRALADTTPRTRETPASPAMGVAAERVAATPRGNAFASSTPRAVASSPATPTPRSPGGRRAVLALAAIAVLLGSFTASALVALAIIDRGRGERESGPATPTPTRPPSPSLSTSEPGARSGSEPGSASASESAAGSVSGSAAEPSSGSSPSPRSMRSRASERPTIVSGRALHATSPAESGESPAVAPQPSESTGWIRVGERDPRELAARERVGAGDFRGCVQALEGVTATLDVLWLRASCANHVGDRPTVERACSELRTRFPGSGYVAGCRALTL